MNITHGTGVILRYCRADEFAEQIHLHGFRNPAEFFTVVFFASLRISSSVRIMYHRSNREILHIEHKRTGLRHDVHVFSDIKPAGVAVPLDIG